MQSNQNSYDDFYDVLRKPQKYALYVQSKLRLLSLSLNSLLNLFCLDTFFTPLSNKSACVTNIH